MTPQVSYDCLKLSPSDNQAAANCKKLWFRDLPVVLLLSAASPKVSITVTNCHSFSHQLTSNRHTLSSMFTQFTQSYIFNQWPPSCLWLSPIVFHWPSRWPLIVTNCQTVTPQVTYNCQKLSPSVNQAAANCKKMYFRDLPVVLLLSAANPKVLITVTNCHPFTHQLNSNRHTLSSMFTQLTSNCHKLSPIDPQMACYCGKLYFSNLPVDL